MGQLISAVLQETEEKHELDTVEQLQILQKMVSAVLEANSEKMKRIAMEDSTLPIVAVVDKLERYAVKAESVPSGKIEETINNLFEGNFLDGLKSAVTVAVKELLGNTSAGEQERSETHVVFANNSLLRVDYYMYKYEFSSDGLRKKLRNAFCYIVHVAVLDNKRVDPQVALYQLGKSIGRDKLKEASENLEEDAKFLEKLYYVINHLRKTAASDDTEPPTRKQAAIQEQQMNASLSQQTLKNSDQMLSPILPVQTKSQPGNGPFWQGSALTRDGVKVNSAGATARKGKTGLYYCGRKVLTCSCCDGHCGPTNGCNCPACQILDNEEQ